MADCNIRNIDDALLQKMKLAALQNGMTLKEWTVKAFEIALNQDSRYLMTDDQLENSCAVGTGYSTLPQISKPNEERWPDHAPNCKCFICKPPKEQ